MEKPNAEQKPRVFISHSSKDNGFVRRLVKQLSLHNLNVWFDERDIKPGDSIVDVIGTALGAAKYVIVVLSEHSMVSPWVRAELNAALMRQLSNQGIVVLPIKIDDCTLPALLSDRLYVDFRGDFDAGVERLVEVLDQESPRSPKVLFDMEPADVADCYDAIASKSDADVRRIVHKRFNRVEIRALWHEVLKSDMNDEVPLADHLGCALELVIRSRRIDRMTELCLAICTDKPGACR